MAGGNCCLASFYEMRSVYKGFKPLREEELEPLFLLFGQASL